MAYILYAFEPYTVIDGVEYYDIKTVCKIVKKSDQTLRLWDSYSDILESEGKPRLIPKARRVNKNRLRCWTEDQIKEIIKYSKNVKFGELARFNRPRWQERGNVKQDRSPEARKARNQYRKLVNKTAKQVQNRRKVEEIKSARADMLKVVRTRAKESLKDVDYNLDK